MRSSLHQKNDNLYSSTLYAFDTTHQNSRTTFVCMCVLQIAAQSNDCHQRISSSEIICYQYYLILLLYYFWSSFCWWLVMAVVPTIERIWGVFMHSVWWTKLTEEISKWFYCRFFEKLFRVRWLVFPWLTHIEFCGNISTKRKANRWIRLILDNKSHFQLSWFINFAFNGNT